MQSNNSSISVRSTNQVNAFLIFLVCLAALLSVLFHKVFDPAIVAFSNDGPLGVMNSSAFSMPAAFRGIWLDQVWLGENGGHAFAALTPALWMLGPLGYAKFYEPIALFTLGVCAWIFFRTLGLKAAFCAVAGIAAALNSNFFSNAAWGLGSRATTLAFTFLALAALNTKRTGNKWLNGVLAGLATGMVVVEGGDNGVIFSLYVGAYVVWYSFVVGDSLKARLIGSLRLFLVVGFALLMAMQSLIVLFGFAEKGAVSAQDETEAREKKWVFATQWSLPPIETLRVIIPGLQGYRMNAPDGRNERMYWGRVGESPGFPGTRFSGAGEYAGLLVVFLSFWAVIASFSKSLNVFSAKERKFIWFWAAMVLISVLISWGRFAPFFKLLIYPLPYLSSMRNPMKFMHPAHLGLMVLFGYGLLGLSRRYLETASTPLSFVAQLKSWWSKAVSFEKRWVWGMAGLLALSAFAYLFYNASRPDLVKHLTTVGFSDPASSDKLAQQIASYSIYEVGLYVVWLMISGVALLLIMGGVFGGKRSRWAAILLGLVLTLDLARANLPWVVYWNYPKKYATNPVVDILRDKPFKGRIITPPFLMESKALASYGGYNHLFPSLYNIEWVQHHFPYYNVQCLDVAQDPRPPADKEAYMRAMMRDPGRYWQLTNTRYILGMTGFLDALNTQLDQGRNRFRIVTTFEVQTKPGIQYREPQDLTVGIVTNGPFALFEFTGALPRAKLYSHWQVSTNDDATLKTLTDPEFDPWNIVHVADEIPASAATTNDSSGTVEIVGYKSRRIEIRASASAPSILLLNDRYDPDWHVTVNGQPAKVLRANFIMRGVQLPPGDHTVVFTFEPSLKGLKISIVAIGIGFALCALLFFVRQPDVPEQAPAPAAPPHGRSPRK